MSIFDAFDKNLPGDRNTRKVVLDADEYEQFSQEEVLTRQPQSLWVFYATILLVFLGLTAQLLNLQITHGSFNLLLAESNRVRDRESLAPRGIIYDQKGKALVVNDVAFVLQLFPVDLPRESGEREKFYANLSTITQIPIQELKDKVKEKGMSADPAVLKENIDRDTALLLETKIINLPGVVMAKQPIRHYIETAGLAPVIGYVGKLTDEEFKNNRDPSLKMNHDIGKSGLEKVYQNDLKGTNGTNKIEVDSQGRAQRILTDVAPEPGNNLILGLDADLETKMSESLSLAIRWAGVSAGAAVAINPQNGEVLGLVSWPTYDNNLFSQGTSNDEYQKSLNNPAQPMFNRAISGAYPSGSTIKPMVASAGLQEGVITENTTINDTGQITVGNYVYPDWKAHGLVDVRKALAVSANVFFYAVGGGWDKIRGLGPDKLNYYLQKFGLGAKTGIDLSGEVEGLVPSPEWKEKTKKEMWYLGDTYHMAIGQGDVLTTPLQMVVSTAAIANNGELLRPHLVRKITDKEGNTIKEFSKEIVRSDFIDNSNLAIVRSGMRDCVTQSYGSCRTLSSLPVAVAAKTGTAQFGNEGKTHGWMVAFAPYENPTIAIAVIIEGGGEGFSTAEPVVQNIFNWYFSQ